MSLTHCPRCDYSLDGLPAAHACPECGLEYDECSFVHVPRMQRWLLVGMCCLWGFVAAYSLVAGVAAPVPFGRRMPFLFGSIYWAGLAAVMFLLNRRGLARVVFVPGGVLRRGLLGKWSARDWAGIEEVHVKQSWLAAGVHLRGRGVKPIGIGACDLSREQVERLAARIRACMMRYQIARGEAETGDE